MVEGTLSDRILIRPATAADIEPMTALHAASHRSAYRGILPDSYLDGPMEDERRALWTGRLGEPAVLASTITLVAEDVAPHLAGLISILPDHDENWGSYIHNLHVAPDRKGRGIGRSLLREAMERLALRSPDPAVHLHVYEENRAAVAVYDHFGGQMVERTLTTRGNSGEIGLLRYSWPSPAAVLAGISRR
jgi:ribosomal protein S18 acetylase RimI-like enzyme